jgi:hypothetical protein
MLSPQIYSTTKNKRIKYIYPDPTYNNLLIYKNEVFNIIILIIGCGTHKVDTVKRDSISINNTYSNGSKIVLSTDVIFEPIDALKPFKIDGKVYENVKVTNSKKEIVEKWRIEILQNYNQKRLK